MAKINWQILTPRFANTISNVSKSIRISMLPIINGFPLVRLEFSFVILMNET